MRPYLGQSTWAWSGSMVAVVTLVLAAVAVYALRRHARSRALTSAQSLLIVLSSSIVMLGSGWWLALRERMIDVPAAPNPPRVSERLSRLSIRSGSDVPQPAGTLLPDLEAADWLNGPAVTRADLAGKVVVLDLWDDL